MDLAIPDGLGANGGDTRTTRREESKGKYNAFQYTIMNETNERWSLLGCFLTVSAVCGWFESTVVVGLPGPSLISVIVAGEFHHIPRRRSRMSESATTAEPSAKKPLYEGSTQFRNWRFSREQLAQKRSVLNVAAVEAVRRVIENDSARQLTLWSAPSRLLPT